jgi:hypothetical protein
MPRYNINAQWVDPYEQREEHRSAPRFSLDGLRLSLAVEDASRKSRLVGPGVVENISESGAYVVTKHQLSPRQSISLSIPTTVCADNVCLPEAFFGGANVVRVEEKSEKRAGVALRFGESFSQNMEFTMFIDSLRNVATIMSSPN